MEKFKYKYDELINPVLKALHSLGGSGTNSEIEEKIIEDLNLSEEEIEDIHRGNITKLHYRSAWARNYLKNYGLIENSERGIWALNSDGLKTPEVNSNDVKKKVKDSQKKDRTSKIKNNQNDEDEVENNFDWKEELLNTIKDMPPASFERLCQRFLRELGFQNVIVTGQPNDGGIDGKGLLKLGGVLSFHVVFQAKRYKEVVSPSVIRDFRGSMSANVDKGLVITTGRFTREAQKEAHRDGALPIDLIDGEELVEKLKELKIGVKIEMVEKVSLVKSWFEDF
jgi:restriction system protein